MIISVVLRESRIKNHNMKTLQFALIAILAITTFTSCKKNRIKPSDDITTETRTVSGFDGLAVSDAMDVVVTYDSTAENVTIEANSNLHEYILTDVVGGVLKVRLKNNVCIKSGATIHVYVTTDELNKIDVSGASRVEFTNSLNANQLDLDVSGASTFQGGMNLSSCDFDISGASSVEVWGASDQAHIDERGASTLRDYDFHINTLDLSLSGASSAFLTVNGLMDIDASGASTFKYRGDGVIDDMNVSGASSIIKD